jgi:antitoxin component YwqK of YwqJK toxin-antitoxin module
MTFLHFAKRRQIGPIAFLILLLGCSNNQTSSQVNNDNENLEKEVDKKDIDTTYIYHDNGQIKSITSQKNGYKNGEEMFYDENGIIEMYKYFVYDSLRYMAFYNDGKYKRFKGYPIIEIIPKSFLTDKEIEFNPDGTVNLQITLAKPPNVEMEFQIQELLNEKRLHREFIDLEEGANRIEYRLKKEEAKTLVIRYSHITQREDESTMIVGNTIEASIVRPITN